MPRRFAAAAGAATAAAYVTDRIGRSRTRRAVESTRSQLTEALTQPPPPSPEQRREDVIVELLLERPVAIKRDAGAPITTRIHAKLREGDVALVEARIEDGYSDLYATSDARTRKRLALNFAAAYGVGEVLERAGLSAAMPPDEIHSMARGPVAAGGDAFTADLIFDALAHAGLEVRDGATVLDFGASSGRVLRVVAAGRPDLRCLGCDPNAEATAWAAEHLPAASFFVSPQRPQLALADASVQMAYAISIWSHFAEEPAIEWLAEMHRVIAPGGALVVTTHAFDSLATSLRRGHISRQAATTAASALVRGRHHFVDVFGPEGDWGVRDAGWGNAYLTLEWLLSRTDDDWAVRLHWPGALDRDQDLTVLQRR